MDIDNLLSKDKEDRAGAKITIVGEALSLASTIDSGLKVPNKATDADEMEKADKVLSGAENPGLDQLVSFLSLLADERRLLRDRRARTKSHKRLWAGIYDRASRSLKEDGYAL